MSLGDKPAFPVALPNQQRGMTLLEHYAGLAMQGLMTRKGPLHETDRAKIAISQARALIAELEKQS